jgi:hypothetical protein
MKKLLCAFKIGMLGSQLCMAYAVEVPVPHYVSIILPSTIQKISDPSADSIPVLLIKGTYSLTKIDKGTVPYKALFEFADDKSVFEYYYLVTPYLTIPKDLEIKHWETSPDHPYRLFHISCRPYTGTIKEEQELSTTASAVPVPKKISDSMYEWVIRELNNSKPILQIPDNTIVFFAEPSWIQIRPVIFDMQHPFKLLPSVVYANTVTEQQFTRKTLEMVWGLIDFKPFFTKPSPGVRALASSQTLVQIPILPKTVTS